MSSLSVSVIQSLDLRGQQTFSERNWVVSIFGLSGHMVSVAATQLCHCSSVAATDSIQINSSSKPTRFGPQVGVCLFLISLLGKQCKHQLWAVPEMLV